MEQVEVDKFLEEEVEYEGNKELSNTKWTQKIYFGPPGTGKSYNVTKEIIKHQKYVGLISEDSEEYDNDYVYRTTIYNIAIMIL